MLHYDEGLPKQLRAGAEVGAVGARTASGAPPPVPVPLSAGTGCPTRAPVNADALLRPPPAGLCGCRPGHPPQPRAVSKPCWGHAVMAPSLHLQGACIWVVTKVITETSRVLVPIQSTPASLGMKGATKHEGEVQTSVPGREGERSARLPLTSTSLPSSRASAAASSHSVYVHKQGSHSEMLAMLLTGAAST